MPLSIEALGRHHRPLLEDFRNQHTSLAEYLRRFALRHAEKDLLARTFLALDRGVDERVQGQGLGRYLFEEALGLTLQLARSGPVAFRLFVTDAIDEAAAHFYERFGLSRIAEEFPCRMVLDLKPLLGRS